MRRKKQKRKPLRGRAKAGKPPPPVPLRRRLLRALPLMLLAVLFTAGLNRLGLLTQLETTLLDTQMRLDMPEAESEVVVIDITQHDFESHFQGQTRPLKPDALWSLIDAVAKGRPCVIGVDLDTHFAQFKDFKVPPHWPPVVWAREVAELPAGVNEKPVPLDVLGGQSPALNERSGIPLLIDDAGSQVTRRYTRLIETTLGPLPSFAWAVYRERRARDCEGGAVPRLAESTEPLLIRYARGREGTGRTRLTAAQVLGFAGEAGWPDKGLLAGKTVLLGGSYLGDDRHDTPLGRLTGVEVTANVVETELRGGGIKPPNKLTLALLLLFDGVVLIALFQTLPFRKAFLINLPLIVVLSLACSYLTYRSLSRWAFFAPVMLGVLLAEMLDMLKDVYKALVNRLFGPPGGPAHREQKP